jgi:mono/diheme cytochrome c family protein
MKKALKIFVYIAAVVAVIILGFISYVKLAFPKVSPPPQLTVVANPEMVKRGEYLANHVVGCIDCHSTRDWNKLAGPIIPGTEGKGGEKFDHETAGVPGVFYARNITPYNLKNWSDGELYRLITTGVTKDGNAIFPLMPYKAYANLDPEDVKAIISYIRTLSEKEGKYPAPQYDFPLNMILPTIPSDPSPMKRPAPTDTLAYGKYLVTIAACGDCHTPAEKGTPIPGMNFAGGFEFRSPITGDIVRSANITQDQQTGIGLWTEETFLSKFNAYKDSSLQNKIVKAGEFNTAMPWILFAGMEEGDLKAIYRYLRTIPPVVHAVEKFTPKSTE